MIENTQRDLNIALMNELAIIFNRLKIDTSEVLEAAGTKWNFLKFKPGLVGGHCIGVDPYYLTYKANMIGYHPEVILAGRKINDGMAKYIAEMTIKKMISKGCAIKGSSVNILGLTFKENCSDIRNSKVADIVLELESFGVNVFVTDPYANSIDAKKEYGVKILEWDDLPKANAIVAAVSHAEYVSMSTEKICEKLMPGGIIVDVKSFLDSKEFLNLGHDVWRL